MHRQTLGTPERNSSQCPWFWKKRIFSLVSHGFIWTCYLGLRIRGYFKSHLLASHHRTSNAVLSFVFIIEVWRANTQRMEKTHIFLKKKHRGKIHLQEKNSISPAIGLNYVYRPTVKGCCLYNIFFCPEQCLISSVEFPGSEVTIWVEAGWKLALFYSGEGPGYLQCVQHYSIALAIWKMRNL